MNLSPGDKVILVCGLWTTPTKEEATIRSVEENCYVVQRKKGTMIVNLDGSIPNWGKESYMVKSLS